ncbi:MAG: 1-acyl-sn-glycerol-3-phosphate acyltransferase [Myxococcales bacterium]|nr:1-acyl-sn-glycerol-3-phosphate acyltransferase [Myxococcales bacterium]
MALEDGARLLVETAASFVTPALAEEVRSSLNALLEQQGEEARRELLRRLVTTGEGWGYFPPNRLARRINFALGELTVTRDSALHGARNLPGVGTPSVYLANHLSFSDANLFAYLLEREGHAESVERLCVLAGPKVFTEAFRRFSSLCFGAIKLPQSPSRASGEAVMPRREVARLAAETISTCEERLRGGDHLLIFVEGTRSRAAAMQPALGAVSRYLEVPGTQIVPLALTGTEHLVPIGEEHAHTTHVDARIGRAISAEALADASEGKRGTQMHAVGLAIARLLPESYRGFYADETQAELAPAVTALDALEAR